MDGDALRVRFDLSVVLDIIGYESFLRGSETKLNEDFKLVMGVGSHSKGKEQKGKANQRRD